MLEVYYESVECLNAESRENAKAWDMLAYHYHNGYELYFLTEGDRKITINGQQYFLKPGELLVISPYDLHLASCGNSNSVSRYIVSFSMDILKSFITEKETEYLLKDIRSCVIALNSEQQAFILSAFKNIRKHIYGGKPLDTKIGKFYLVTMIEYLKEISPDSFKVFERKERVLRREIVEALEFINKNLADSTLDIKNVAKHINMSQSRFCELFKQATGISCLKYINAMRLMHVERELWTSDKKLKDIAKDSGFSSVQHMSRVFSASYNMTPTEYRLKNRKN